MKNSREKVFEFIKKAGVVSPGVISNQGFVGEQMLYRHLKRMIEDGEIEKIGKSPKTFYKVIKRENKMFDGICPGGLNAYIQTSLSKEITDTIEREFYFIDPVGRELFGEVGFYTWCKKREFDFEKKAREYFSIFNKYKKVRKNNLLNATSKVKTTFGDDCCLEKLFYYDFYSVEVFGKTKMGQKVLYAKNSGNRKRILKVSQKVESTIKNLIKREKIDSVVFVPPTVPRKNQFMKIIESNLKLGIPKIKVIKSISDVRVPQKTLKRLKDRIENATETFLVDDNSVFKKTLVIDDAVGSGASINQIACKLKTQGNTKKVIGFAIVGSLNDFEVISEI